MFIIGVSRAVLLAIGSATTAVAAAWFVRSLSAWHFKQDWRGVLLHPLGVLLRLAIQWFSLLRRLRGGVGSWKDRAYLE